MAVFIVQCPVHVYCCTLFNCTVLSSCGVSLVHQQHRLWANLGFVRAIAKSSVIRKALARPQWVDLLLPIILSDSTMVDCASLPQKVIYLYLLLLVTNSYKLRGQGPRRR